VAAIEKALAKGVDGIVISLLNAYRNPAHEAQVAAIRGSRRSLTCSSSGSSEVWPIIREYERTTTALINGYVHPKVSDYLEKLIEGLRAAA
jgi:N-methylhydantoinase A